MTSEYNKGWLIGFLDSEGSFSWPTPYNPRVTISNTNLCMLQKAQELLGGIIVPTSNPGRACFNLQIGWHDWSCWLLGMVLVEHEGKRQEFLRWLLKKKLI